MLIFFVYQVFHDLPKRISVPNKKINAASIVIERSTQMSNWWCHESKSQSIDTALGFILYVRVNGNFIQRSLRN